MTKFLTHFDKCYSNLAISSGYPNLPNELQSRIADIKGRVNIVFGNPLSSIWWNKGGIKSMVPYFYRLSMMKFMKKARANTNIKFWEHYQKGKTFHQKSIWCENS